MTFRWDTSDLETSSALKADHVNSAVEAVQAFVNQGIEQVALADAIEFTDATSADRDVYDKQGWVQSEQIYRPEFYGSPSPRMIAVSGQTHFRESNNDWSKGAVFGPQVTGSGWCAVPNLSTTIKLRHSATVNVMCSFYAFEFGGVSKSQASGNDQTQTGTHESIDLGRRLGPAGYFLKNVLEGEVGGERRVSTSHGYESKVAGWVRLQVNGTRHKSTQRVIYTSHVDARKAYDFPVLSDSPGAFSCLVAQNGYIFMPMIGRHLHHMTFQVNLTEGVHNIGVCFKSSANSEGQQVSLASVRNMNDSDFAQRKGFTKSSAPRVRSVKNVFFLSRNLVVDCYYRDNEPL